MSTQFRVYGVCVCVCMCVFYSSLLVLCLYADLFVIFVTDVRAASAAFLFLSYCVLNCTVSVLGK